MPQETTSTGIVESLEVQGKRVGEFILQHDKELTLAGAFGIALKGPQETTSYAILLGRPLPRRWGIFRRRRPLIGYLNIKPTKDKRWLLEIYGRGHCERLQKLAQALTEKFKSEIHIRLESEDSRREGFNWDAGWDIH